ncbi:CBS domain-containing protein [Tunturiibacter empetritectus]|uniref:CBS domain-containing protein n=1 Tax=Tunturiibacter empetritectus TaxID=3069691 RepID=UPI003D9B2058
MDANGRKVAELFDKYNLRSLPVIDNEKHLAGVIHAEQVIALLRASPLEQTSCHKRKRRIA